MGIIGFDLAVLAVAVVLIALVWRVMRAERRTRAAGQPVTRWATAALFVVRAALVLGLISVIGGVVEPRSSQRLGAIVRDQSKLTIAVTTSDVSALCAQHHIRVGGRHLVPGRECDASRAFWSAQPQGATAAGAVLKVSIPKTASGESRRFSAIAFLRGVFWLLAFLALERILSATSTRRPFAPSNIAWLRVLAATVVSLGVLVPAMVERLTVHLVNRYGDLDYAHEGLRQTLALGGSGRNLLAPLAIAILLLVLAEVWRFGIRLQEDVEATV